MRLGHLAVATLALIVVAGQLGAAGTLVPIYTISGSDGSGPTDGLR